MVDIINVIQLFREFVSAVNASFTKVTVTYSRSFLKAVFCSGHLPMDTFLKEFSYPYVDIT